MSRSLALASWGAAILFGALAAIDTQSLAQWFTHPLLAERSGVAIREVSWQGAQWFRIACVVAACAWVVLPRVICRLCASATPARTDPDAGATTRIRLRWVLFVVIALGLALRLQRMGESFWFDELAALLDYAQYGVGPVIGSYFVQSNHVLHTVATAVVVDVADGANEILLRIPALLAGVLVIGAFARLGIEAARWRTATLPAQATEFALAALCAACGALLPICILESVEARGYSMVILFAALATALLLRAWRTASPLALCAYGVVCALGVWTHLTFIALPMGHAVVALARRRDRTTRRQAAMTLLALALAGATAMAMLSPLLPDLLRIRGEFRALDGNEPSLLSAEGLRILLGLGGSWWLDAIPGLALALIGVAHTGRDRCRGVPLALALAGVPLIVLGTALGGSWMYARFSLLALPGVALAISMGALDMAALARTRQRHRLLIVGAAALVLMWSSTSLLLPPKQPIRDAVDFVDAHASPGATIACAGLPDNVPAYYGLLLGHTIADAGVGGCDLASVSPAPDWLIVLYPRSVGPAASEALSRGWDLAAKFEGWVDWDNGAVLVYKRR